MMEFIIGDMVMLTTAYIRDWCPDERLAEDFEETTRPKCDYGIILKTAKSPHNEDLSIYSIHWFPANKVYEDHSHRLNLLSRMTSAEFENIKI